VVARDTMRKLVAESTTARSSLWMLELKDSLETAVSNLEAIKDRFP